MKLETRAGDKSGAVDQSRATEILFGDGVEDRCGGVTSITLAGSRGVEAGDGAVSKAASEKSGAQDESVSIGFALGEVPAITNAFDFLFICC